MKVIFVVAVFLFVAGSSYASNCAGRLLDLRPDYNSTQLNRACSGTDHNCILDLAAKRPDFSSVALRKSCEIKFEHEFGSNCAGRLIELRKDYNFSMLRRACFGTDHSCILDLAEKRPRFSSTALQKSCLIKYYTEFNSNCPGRLLELRPNFRFNMLRRSCFGTDHSCVLDVAEKRPNFNSVALQKSCFW